MVYEWMVHRLMEVSGWKILEKWDPQDPKVGFKRIFLPSNDLDDLGYHHSKKPPDIWVCLIGVSESFSHVKLWSRHPTFMGYIKAIWGWVKTLYPCSSHQNSWDLWMFIPLKMVSIGIDPYPYIIILSFYHYCLVAGGYLLSGLGYAPGTYDPSRSPWHHGIPESWTRS